MLTVVLEKMPDLFWSEIEAKNYTHILPFEEHLRESAEIVIVRTHFILSPEQIDSFKKLKLIIRAGTGFDNIACKYAISKGIEVCNTPDSNVQSAFEQTISFLFMMIKQSQICHNQILKNRWKNNLSYNLEINELRILLVGVGRIGTKVANFLRQFGAQVKGVDPYLSETEWNQKQVEQTSYEDGLKWCNSLSFHCPLTSETTHYFNEASLKILTHPIYLLNVARGNIVDMNSLLKGLKNKQIIAAGIDVFPDEPNPNVKDFLHFENIYFSPHIGAFTNPAKDRMSLETIEVWENYVFHNKLISQVDLRFI